MPTETDLAFKKGHAACEYGSATCKLLYVSMDEDGDGDGDGCAYKGTRR